MAVEVITDISIQLNTTKKAEKQFFAFYHRELNIYA